MDINAIIDVNCFGSNKNLLQVTAYVLRFINDGIGSANVLTAKEITKETHLEDM